MYSGTLKHTRLLALPGDTTTAVTYADACVLYIQTHMWGRLPFQAALLVVGGVKHPGCELDLCGCQPFAVLLRKVCGSGNGPLDPNHGASTR